MSTIQEPRIEQAPAKLIIGQRIQMTLANPKTQELWQMFGPRKKEIAHRVGQGSYSIQVYGESFLKNPFTPQTPFEKWAGVQVYSHANLPEGMEAYTIPSGTWAVFDYRGSSDGFHNAITEIFSKWLPNLHYTLALGPHFEYMPPEYLGPTHPDAHEEIWIPIKG